MSNINKGRKLLFLILFGILMLSVTGGTALADSSQNMIAYAKKNKVSRGKWIKNSNGIRYKKSNGTYVKDTWCVIDGSVYCFDQKGYVKTRSFKYDDRRYYADTCGRVYISKWRKSGTKMYYYGSDGVRAEGWKTIRGKCYYFKRTGEMAVSSWVGNSYVDSNGVRVTQKTVDGRKINKSGEIQKTSQKDKYIIVGASRIVDMSVAVNSSDTVFIAKSGQGYRWLKSTAGPTLMSYLKQNPDRKVIFQLGNNDLSNINLYISYYRYLMKKYPYTEFYFLDATPGKGSGASKNKARQQFNEQMKDAFGNLCLGGYDYLVSIQFTTVDGTHYTSDVSKKLYKYAIRAAERESEENRNRVSDETDRIVYENDSEFIAYE